MAIFEYPENVTGMLSLFSYANSVTNGWFASIILFAVFMVAFLAQKQYVTHRAFATSMFLTTIIAIIFKTLDLISTQVLIASMIGLIGAFVWLWFGEKHEID